MHFVNPDPADVVDDLTEVQNNLVWDEVGFSGWIVFKVAVIKSENIFERGKNK